MQPKENPLEHFDSPKSENGEINDIKGIKGRIQFYENKKVTFKLPEEAEAKTPGKIEAIKQKLLKRVYGEEDDVILSGEYCELTDSDDSNIHSPKKEVTKKTLSVTSGNLNERIENKTKDIEDIKKVDLSEQNGRKSKFGVHEEKILKTCSCQNLNEESEILKSAEISANDSNESLEYGSKIKYAFKISQEVKENKEIDSVFNALDNLCREKRKSKNISNSDQSRIPSAKEIYRQQPEITFEDYSMEISNNHNLDYSEPKETRKSETLILEHQDPELYEPESTCCSLQCENLDEELRTITIREMIKNVENEINRERIAHSESLESENLPYTEIEMPDVELYKSHLPTTQEFLDDYSLFSSRPSFLNISQTVNPTIHSVTTRNLYNGKNLIFSNSDTLSKEFKFRAPGAPLPNKPILTPISSILTETSVLHYIKVSVKDSDTHWYVLKELNNSDKLIPYNSDEDLNQFILTDIVTEIFKRSNFLIYDHRVVTGKFIGKALCLCKDTACLKSLSCSNVERISRTKMLVDGVELEVSCETERNEWIDTIMRVSCS